MGLIPGAHRAVFLMKVFHQEFVSIGFDQVLHETAQRAMARWECAQHTGFSMKGLHRETGLEREENVHGMGAALH